MQASSAGVLPGSLIKIALPVPFRRTFDYLLPPGMSGCAVGTRVSVPFGHQKKSLVGIVVGVGGEPAGAYKLREINEVLDPQPVVNDELFALCHWCADYYHYPLGEVFQLALPAVLRKPVPQPQALSQVLWQLSDLGQTVDLASLNRVPKQRALLQFFKENNTIDKATLKQAGFSTPMLNKLVAKQWLLKREVQAPRAAELLDTATLLKQPPLDLNDEQARALAQFRLDQFKVYLLEGVTGSGKTEIYLQAIAQVLINRQQVLVLVPEIGLTPQTVARFQQRFHVPIATVHSGLGDKERYHIWQQAGDNQFGVIIGTRSSIFTPLPRLGLVIIDEEHDLSYKQQDGVRYSARDLAIVRAQKQQIPLILGSATPALESLHNGLSGRYEHLSLLQRANDRPLPQIRCVDAASDHLEADTVQSIQQSLAQGQQVLVFINRRGYAPTLMCQSCGWISQCQNCDNRMTLHRDQQSQRLHCHQCDTCAPVPLSCPQCQSHNLTPLGAGTQRSEQALAQLFPDTPIIRVDRDSVARKGDWQRTLAQINSGEPCIIVGTQMLAKGHHFAGLGLAVVLGIDSAFFGGDFRGPERIGQLLTQVAGRVGREQHLGQVLIQTQFREHPLMQQLLTQGYHRYAQQLLAQRRLADMPPLSHLALIRCHAHQPTLASQFLQQARQRAETLVAPHRGLLYLGPFSATPEKRNNRYHYYLQIKSASRGERRYILQQLCDYLEKARQVKGVHWQVDVDPQEF
ncbi:MAG: primosomal protein N' [Cellvibrionaceae bacterium]|nr:primosomal protein N' [Cellvibrionaceae bacterium]